jgi:ATP-dependent Lhr-like helicase
MVKDDGPCVLTLGGRSWQTKYIDWPRRKAYVEPTELRGKSQWLSSGQPLHFALSQAIPRALTRDDSTVTLSQRATQLMEELQEEYDWIAPDSTFLITYDTNDIVWWTFAGMLVNAAIAASLAQEADKVTSDNLSVSFTGGVTPEVLKQAIADTVLAHPDDVVLLLDEEFLQELKFGECLSTSAKERELRARYSVSKQVKQIASSPMIALRIYQ